MCVCVQSAAMRSAECEKKAQTTTATAAASSGTTVSNCFKTPMCLTFSPTHLKGSCALVCLSRSPSLSCSVFESCVCRKTHASQFFFGFDTEDPFFPLLACVVRGYCADTMHACSCVMRCCCADDAHFRIVASASDRARSVRAHNHAHTCIDSHRIDSRRRRGDGIPMAIQQSRGG